MSRKVRAICLGAIALVVIPGSIAALAAGSAKPNVHVSCTLGGTSVITWANYVTGSLQAEYTKKPYLHELDGRSGEIDAPIINLAHRGAHGQITVTTPKRVPKGWYLDEVDLWSHTTGRGAMVSLYPIRLCTRPAPPVPTISVAVANNTVLQALGAPINTRGADPHRFADQRELPLQHVLAWMRRYCPGQQRLQHAQDDDLHEGAPGHHSADDRHRRHRQRHIDDHQRVCGDTVSRGADLRDLHHQDRLARHRKRRLLLRDQGQRHDHGDLSAYLRSEHQPERGPQLAGPRLGR